MWGVLVGHQLFVSTDGRLERQTEAMSVFVAGHLETAEVSRAETNRSHEEDVSIQPARVASSFQESLGVTFVSRV